MTVFNEKNILEIWILHSIIKNNAQLINITLWFSNAIMDKFYVNNYWLLIFHASIWCLPNFQNLQIVLAWYTTAAIFLLIKLELLKMDQIKS